MHIFEVRVTSRCSNKVFTEPVTNNKAALDIYISRTKQA